MANKVPVKAIFSGSDVSSLGEFATSDTIAASYINGVPTGSLALAGGTMTGDLILGDNVKLEVGSATGGDLQIYHTGTHSFIADAGTGQLKIITNGTGLDIQKDETETMAKFITDGAVKLYHNNAEKIETTANGVTVTGTAVATTDTDTTNTGSVTLDFAAKQNFVLTLTGNVTLANPTTEQVGQSGFIAFIQDGTGSRTVALGTDYETPAAAGLTLTATASATDLVPYLVVASNRILLGTPQLAFA
jgi:hypothetical protein